MTLDELHALPELMDRPQRYASANVAPITVGDLAVLRDTFGAWNEPRQFCAVCMEPFTGERCPTCGIPRRTKR